MWGALFQHESRNLVALPLRRASTPTSPTEIGFVQRVDQQLAGGTVGVVDYFRLESPGVAQRHVTSRFAPRRFGERVEVDFGES